MYREGQVRIPSGCAICGIFNMDGRLTGGEEIIKSIRVMRERSNGLGGGFAGYGIYPEHKDFYAFHIFYDDGLAKAQCEEYLEKHFEVADTEKIPTAPNKNITDVPLIWRYFVVPRKAFLDEGMDDREFVFKAVMHINSKIDGAYVFSSSKNMGIFKASGYPEDVGEFYKLDTYKAYCWTAHGRYPTNTPGWWGGAHPFGLLDCSVVHNGEISSYDANRRYIEMFGYKCTLLTDTEVITYIIDFLTRKKGLNIVEAAHVIAAPFWAVIDEMEPEQRDYYTYLRMAFSSMLVTGPFSILVAYEGGIMALNDRLKLRSMVAAVKGNTAYFASEESAIRAIQPELDRVWAPSGGEPVIFELQK